MALWTFRRRASARGSDLGSTEVIRSADARGAGGCEARGVNMIRLRTPARTAAETERPLRVLITTDWWEPVVNGVVASVLTLRRELLALGCDVRVLTLAEGFRTHHEPGVYRIGSVSAGMVYDRARIGMPANRRVLQDILAWGPDVVHSQCEFSTYMWARKISRMLAVPLVHTYHTIYEDYTHYYSPSRTVGRKVVASFSRRILAGCDAVVVPTAKVSRLLTGYGVRRPIHVVPTGLDLTRFRPAQSRLEQADVQLLRERAGVRPDQRMLVSVCRLAKEKNLDEVLEMVAACGREDVVLVLVGDGPHRAELEAHARALGIAERVRFMGVVDPSQVQRWYRAGDVFVSASRSETQGLTFIEALACGTPLLCHRDPSIDQVVLDGRTGWQYEDPGEFTALLGSLLDDPRRHAAMSAAAIEHARATCGAQQFARAVMEVYGQVRRRRSRRVIARTAMVA